MSRVIVISVGTSLLTNNLGVEDQKLGTFAEQVIKSLESVSVTDLLKMEFKFDGHSLSSIDNCPNLIGLEDFARAFFNKYLKKDEILKNIKNRESGADRLPAEISSLFLFYYDKLGGLRDEFSDNLISETSRVFRDKDKIILVTTDTSDSVYCAKLVMQMIKTASWFLGKGEVEKLVIVKNLDVYSPEKYISRKEYSKIDRILETGLGQLFAYFDRDFGRNSKYGDRKRIMIRTGGYKEFSSDLKMLAMQFGFTSYYLFERSTEMIVVSQLSWPRDFSMVALKSRRR